jgi:hypothetical protein
MAKRETTKQGAVTTRVGGPKVVVGSPHEGVEHRQFPRALVDVPVSIWIGDGDDQTFSATLRCDNLSVSGAFLRSTFFLAMQTELNLRFTLDGADEPVQARGVILREERGKEEGSSGFGVRFLSFAAQSEIILARLFLGDRLHEFVQQFLQSKRAKSLQSELERVVDTLVAWELQKVNGVDEPLDPWKP